MNHKFELVIDQREHDLIMLIPTMLDRYKLSSVIHMDISNLDIGDIEFRKDGKLYYIFERKSLNDLASSITDGRYKEQSLRLQEACDLPDTHKCYVIEGDLYAYEERKKQKYGKSYGNKQSKSSVSRSTLYGCIGSIIHGKHFRVFRTAHIQDTAETLIRFIDKIRRYDAEFKVDDLRLSTTAKQPTSVTSTGANEYTSVIHKVKHRNITPANIGVICLSQIPYISNTTAVALIQEYGNLYECIRIIRTQPDELKKLKVNGRKLSLRVLDNLEKYLGDGSTTEISVETEITQIDVE